jgi:hypothetical protein
MRPATARPRTARAPRRWPRLHLQAVRGHEKARPARDGRCTPAVPPALRRCPTRRGPRRRSPRHAGSSLRARVPVMALPRITVGAPAGPTCATPRRIEARSRVRSAAREGSSRAAAASGSHRPGLARQPAAARYSLRLSLCNESRSPRRRRSIGSRTAHTVGSSEPALGMAQQRAGRGVGRSPRKGRKNGRACEGVAPTKRLVTRSAARQ